MKTTFTFMVSLLMGVGLQSIAQVRDCGKPNESFCPGNYLTNGNFEEFKGNPDASVDQDIDLATGWSAIWSQSSLADLYCMYSTNISPALYSPTNPDGVYSGMWIMNTDSNSAAFREGMYNRLATPIQANSGSYVLNFDACDMSKVTTLPDEDVVVGIFGVYNPGNIVALTPTQMFVPTDFNLWPSGSGVHVYKLGSVVIPASAVHTFQPYSVNFNSNAITMSTEITHIMVTRDDVPINDGLYHRRYIGFDNFCIQRVQDPPSDNSGAYCCKESENLFPNGNFENSASGFFSQYHSNPAVYPGQYTISNDASSFGTTISDHSYCEDPVQFATNNQFMLINGLTNQPPGSTSVVLGQNLNLDPKKQYRFCFNAKNLAQCTFDVLPEIQVEVNGMIVIPFTVIQTNQTAPCDWQLFSGCFEGKELTRFVIRLREDNLGDGNDFALDDISIQEIVDPNYSLTVTHDGSNSSIVATSNDYPFNNQICENQSQYNWFVYETNDPINLTIVPGTFAWSDQSGSYGSVSSSTPWNMPTTNFPNYLIFGPYKFYVIGLFVGSCCESCTGDGWTYQITYNFANKTEEYPVLTPERKEQIKALFVKNYATETAIIAKDAHKVQIVPNPNQGQFQVKSAESISGKMEIYDMRGQKVQEKQIQNQSDWMVNISNQLKGIFILKFITDQGEVFNHNIIYQ